MTLTDQQIFDECISHVIKQGVQATGTSGCEYLTRNGLSCALGGPIVNRGLYNIEIEGDTPSTIRDTPNALDNILAEWGVVPDQYKLLRRIQKAHDNAASDFFLNSFKVNAREVAKEFKLNTEAIT